MDHSVEYTPIHPEQTGLYDDILRKTGYMAQPAMLRTGEMPHGPTRRVSIASRIALIGEMITPEHPDEARLDVDNVYAAQARRIRLPREMVAVPELNIGFAEMKLVDASTVANGLYTAARNRGNLDKALFIAIAGDHKSRSHISGDRGRNTAVLFPHSARKIVVRSPDGLSGHIEGTVRASPENQPTHNEVSTRVNTERKARSGPAKNAYNSIAAMQVLDTERIHAAQTLRRAYRSFRHYPAIRFSPHGADKLILDTDNLLRQTVELSGLGRGLSPEEQATSQEALTAVLYRQPADITPDIWRNLIAVAGQHINAQRAKIHESIAGCRDIYEFNKSAILPEDRHKFSDLD